MARIIHQPKETQLRNLLEKGCQAAKRKKRDNIWIPLLSHHKLRSNPFQSQTPKWSLIRNVTASWCRRTIWMTTRKSFNFVTKAMVKQIVAAIAASQRCRMRSQWLHSFLQSNRFQHRTSCNSVVRWPALRLRMEVTNHNRNTPLHTWVMSLQEEPILSSTTRNWTINSNNNWFCSNRSSSNWSSTWPMAERFRRTSKCTCRWWPVERINL